MSEENENQLEQNVEKTKDDKKNKLEAAPEEPITIMPTMIDDSIDVQEKRRDLSAIIPKEESNNASEGAIAITSKENELKGDGAISIGTINIDGEITMNPNAALPAQIDIAERKKIAQKNKGIFKKEKKKKANKTAQKVQNTTSLMALIIIIGLAGFFYWYKHHPTEKDFQPLTVVVEYGDPLPIRTSSYVKPGVGKEVDELQYALDLSEVKIEEVGEYVFTVTYKGIVKEGTVIIQDTTPPELVVKEYSIKEGNTYDASKFVVSCIDYSGCNPSFQVEAEGKYDFPGTYVIHVTATDGYANTTTKKTSLIIESAGTIKNYVRYYGFSMSAGYEKTEEYEITYIDYDSYSAILRGTRTITYAYQEESKYNEAVKTYSNEAGYSFDDARKEIVYVTSINSVGSNYTKLDDIEEYLKKEGFRSY
ncbi:MAG: hypothetical protein II625_10845 [Bacilli bacterium]|nr:hypothetical protein [Bacilli bacterium]